MKIEGIVTLLPARTGQKADGSQFCRPAFIIQHSSESMYFDCSQEKFDELTRQGFANGANGELRYWASTSNYNGRVFNNAKPQSWLPAAAQTAAAPAQPAQPYAQPTQQPAAGPYTQLAQMQGQQIAAPGYVPTQQPMQQQAPQQNYPFPPPPANL